LADVFGVSYQGRPKAPLKRPELDENFAVAVDEAYWKQRTGVARLSWSDHEMLRDARLDELVPNKSVIVRAPLVAVSEPIDAKDSAVRLVPDGEVKALPGLIARKFGQGRVVYLAAGVDHALWSYAYPYQRILLSKALGWAAGDDPPIQVSAPMCVQATFWRQTEGSGRRLVLHFFIGLNTTAQHGLPAADVPLREETVPIGGIKVRFRGDAPRRFHVEPGNRAVAVVREGDGVVITLPALERHLLLVGEME
jgi:hypothetical protein